MPNPTAALLGVHEGAWLLPRRNFFFLFDKEVYLAAEASPMEHPIMGDEFDPPSRSGKIVQLHEPKGFEGILEGHIEANFNRTARDWKLRLLDLVRNQGDYDDIWLLTPFDAFRTVSLARGYTIAPFNASTRQYEFTLPFVSLDATREAL